MPLFVCEKCNCVENTATSNYWEAKYSTEEGRKPLLCSECDPAIGQWHRRFPKRSAVGMLIDQCGNLHYEDEELSPHFRIVGKVKTEATAVSPWRSITTAPKDRPFLAFLESGGMQVVRWGPHGWTNCMWQVDPMFWMELPRRP